MPRDGTYPSINHLYLILYPHTHWKHQGVFGFMVFSWEMEMQLYEEMG